MTALLICTIVEDPLEKCFYNLKIIYNFDQILLAIVGISRTIRPTNWVKWEFLGALAANFRSVLVCPKLSMCHEIMTQIILTLSNNS